MARQIPIRCAVVCVLVLSFAVISVIGAGIGVAELDTTETDLPTITTPGEGEDAFSGKNKTTLKNTSINHRQSHNTSSKINIFISLSSLEKNNIKTNSSKISNYSVSGASISNISKLTDQNSTVFKIQANPTYKSNRIVFDEINFSDIDGSNINSTVNVRYRLGVSTNKSGRDFSELKEENKITETDTFDIVDNSIKVSDQATVSSQMLNTSMTSDGITISNFVSDITSVIVITHGYNGTRIAGFETQSATPVSGRQNITIEPNIVGGKKRLHVIPKRNINITKLENKNHVPESTLDSAIATDKAHIYSGIVKFNDQRHDNSIESGLTVEKAELLDANGRNTPFIISIHPITSNGNVVYNTTYGYSNRLTGNNMGVEIELGSRNSTDKNVYTSNQLAATLQVYDDPTGESTNQSDSTYVLPNSDLHNQFVSGGIADTAMIDIGENTSLDEKVAHLDQTSGYNNIQPYIYSGTTILANNTVLEQESEKLYRIDSNKKVISAVGDPVANTNTTEFRTYGLQTGNYTFNKTRSDSDSSFKIIGGENRYTNIYNTDRFPIDGEKMSFNIHHNSPNSNIRFINKTTNSTTATIELATPEAGQTTLGINTYAAANGSLNESVTVTGPGSSIESVTAAGETGSLSPGTYEIAIRSEQGIATTSDNATVTLTRRSTNGLTTYRGTEANRSELRSAAAVRDAIDNDTLSRAERVDANDTVVYAVNATGLTGLTAARNATPETGADLDRLDGIEFAVRSTGEEGDVATSDAIGETPRDAAVHVDETGLYVVADGEDALPTDDGPEPGEEFTAEFRVTDDRLREAAADPPDGHTVTSTITYGDTDRGESPDGDTERIGSGNPVDGGGDGERGGSGNAGGSGNVGGSGTTGPSGDTGGNGNSGRNENTGETTEIGDVAGNATGGPDLDSPVGADLPDEPNADNGTTSGNGDRTGPIRGAGFGSRPNSDGPTPALDEPIAVSVPTATVATGPSGAPQSEASSSEVGTAPDETGGEGDSATGRVSGGDAAEAGEATAPDAGADVAEPAATGSERATPTYENAPIRTTAEDLPGFGAIQSLAALSLALLAATRRLRPHS